MAVLKKMMTVFKCERCEHEWVPRNVEETPRVCPKCKSPYWDRPRQNLTTKTAKKRAPAKRGG